MYKKLTLLLLLTLITLAPQSTFAEEATSHIDTNPKNTMINIIQPITINLIMMVIKTELSSVYFFSPLKSKHIRRGTNVPTSVFSVAYKQPKEILY